MPVVLVACGNVACSLTSVVFIERTVMAARKSTSKKSSSSKKKSTRKQSASRKSASSQGKDALALLRSDHQLVQDLFQQYEKARGDSRKAELAERICTELAIHAKIEEEIFYPAVREAIGDDDLMDEALVEHQGAKDLIAQLQKASPADPLFDAKVKVLSEYVKHHVKEEQNEMFKEVRKKKLDLKALGEQLQARKSELQQRGPEATARETHESVVTRVSRTLGLVGS